MKWAFWFLITMTLVTGGVLMARRKAPPSKQTAPVAAASSAPVAEPPPKDPGFIGVVLAGEWVLVEPNVTGRIESFFVKPGDEIKAGAPIAQLDVRSMKHELAVVQSSAAEAALRLSRRQRLVNGTIAAVTPEELDNARFDAARERARAEALARSVAEGTVLAPFGGIVTDQYLAKGALAGPGKPLVRILGKAPPRVRFAIPEDRARTIAADMPVTVQAPNNVNLTGAILNVIPEVDNASGMSYATASVNGSSEFAARAAKGGLIVRVFIPSDTPRSP
jgi:RND family efflux transporter MFP subunit